MDVLTSTSKSDAPTDSLMQLSLEVVGLLTSSVTLSDNTPTNCVLLGCLCLRDTWAVKDDRTLNDFEQPSYGHTTFFPLPMCIPRWVQSELMLSAAWSHPWILHGWLLAWCKTVFRLNPLWFLRIWDFNAENVRKLHWHVCMPHGKRKLARLRCVFTWWQNFWKSTVKCGQILQTYITELN